MTGWRALRADLVRVERDALEVTVDAVSDTGSRFDVADIAGLAGIGAVLILLWLACECAR